MRLLRALEQVRPDSTREFFGLAATQMRRELLDLARHFFGPQGPGAHQAGQRVDSTVSGLGEPADRSEDLEDLERWCLFHQQVEQLPSEEREIVGLIFYHGWTQAQVAELFQINVRTVRRRWEAAMQKLYATFREEGRETPETTC